MVDFDSIFKGFKFGDLEKVFVSIYSYFLIGYLILFTTYEQDFTNLGLHNQILLSVSISFPIMGFATIFVGRPKKFGKHNVHNLGLIYYSFNLYFMASVFYSLFFSLFYIVKHLEIVNYNRDFDSIIAVVIIFLVFIILLISKEKIDYWPDDPNNV